MSEVMVTQVVLTALERRGKGDTLDDPVRIVKQCWTLDGVKLFEHDDWARCPHCKKRIQESHRE